MATPLRSVLITLLASLPTTALAQNGPPTENPAPSIKAAGTDVGKLLQLAKDWTEKKQTDGACARHQLPPVAVSHFPLLGEQLAAQVVGDPVDRRDVAPGGVAGSGRIDIRTSFATHPVGAAGRACCAAA